LAPILALEGKKTDQTQFEKVKAILEGVNGNEPATKEARHV